MVKNSINKYHVTWSATLLRAALFEKETRVTTEKRTWILKEDRTYSTNSSLSLLLPIVHIKRWSNLHERDGARQKQKKKRSFAASTNGQHEPIFKASYETKRTIITVSFLTHAAVPVKTTCVCLFSQQITYLADGKFKQEKKVIGSVCKEQIPRGKNYIWKDRMQIPPLPPSHLKGCKLMDSKYILQVSHNVACRRVCNEPSVPVAFKQIPIVGS